MTLPGPGQRWERLKFSNEQGALPRGCVHPHQRTRKAPSGLAVPLAQADGPLPRRGMGLVVLNRIPKILTSSFLSPPSESSHTYLKPVYAPQSRVLELEGRVRLPGKPPQNDEDGDHKDTKKEARGAGRFRKLY